MVIAFSGQVAMRRQARNIVIGQRVDVAKVSQAKLFRRRMTPAERRLWQAIRNNLLHGLHFRRQQIVSGFIVDFYCHSASLAVEVDGPLHERNVDYDAERDQVLAGLGIHVLRLTNEAVMNHLRKVLAKIARAAEKT